MNIKPEITYKGVTYKEHNEIIATSVEMKEIFSGILPLIDCYKKLSAKYDKLVGNRFISPTAKRKHTMNIKKFDEQRKSILKTVSSDQLVSMRNMFEKDKDTAELFCRMILLMNSEVFPTQLIAGMVGKEKASNLFLVRGIVNAGVNYYMTLLEGCATLDNACRQIEEDNKAGIETRWVWSGSGHRISAFYLVNDIRLLSAYTKIKKTFIDAKTDIVSNMSKDDADFKEKSLMLKQIEKLFNDKKFDEEVSLNMAAAKAQLSNDEIKLYSKLLYFDGSPLPALEEFDKALLEHPDMPVYKETAEE